MSYAQYIRLGVPVSASARAVVRAAYSMLAENARARDTRVARHAWLRSILREHAAARAFYEQVMW